MAVTDYLRVDQLRAALRITHDTFNDQLALAIAAASRAIDEHTNDRFWRDDAPVSRVFTATHPRRLPLPSFATTDGLAVEVDTDDNGTFDTAWTLGADYQAAPTAPQTGWPYTEIQTLGAAMLPGPFDPRWGWGYGPGYGARWWPVSRRARVRVTAVWGWPSVPPQVTQACQILAVDYWKSKDLTGGAAGGAEALGGTQVHLPGLNPLAAALLCGLREPVVA